MNTLPHVPKARYVMIIIYRRVHLKIQEYSNLNKTIQTNANFLYTQASVETLTASDDASIFA